MFRYVAISKFPVHEAKSAAEKPVEKAPKFYPAEDVKKPLVNKRKPKPTKLRQGFRKTYKEKHPLQKSVTVVAKAGAEKWNTLSSGEKAHYEAKAAKAKLEYEKLVKDQTQRN